MIREHKIYGAVEITGQRETVGGNTVVDATDENGIERILLADRKYWGKAEPQTLEEKQAAMRRRNGKPDPVEVA